MSASSNFGGFMNLRFVPATFYMSDNGFAKNWLGTVNEKEMVIIDRKGLAEQIPENTADAHGFIVYHELQHFLAQHHKKVSKLLNMKHYLEFEKEVWKKTVKEKGKDYAEYMKNVLDIDDVRI